MRFRLAIKAFFKALNEPKKAEQFLEETNVNKQIELETDYSHLRLLYYLQQTSRFVDFFKEDIESFSDAQVGAAVRKIHQDCSKAIEELVTIRPLKEENEGSKIQIPKGYNPAEIKIVGKVKGEPPYTGVLVHRGWVAKKRSLPKVGEQTSTIICPAEIEIKS